MAEAATPPAADPPVSVWRRVNGIIWGAMGCLVMLWIGALVLQISSGAGVDLRGILRDGVRFLRTDGVGANAAAWMFIAAGPLVGLGLSVNVIVASCRRRGPRRWHVVPPLLFLVLWTGGTGVLFNGVTVPTLTSLPALERRLSLSLPPGTQMLEARGMLGTVIGPMLVARMTMPAATAEELLEVPGTVWPPGSYSVRQQRGQASYRMGQFDPDDTKRRWFSGGGRNSYRELTVMIPRAGREARADVLLYRRPGELTRVGLAYSLRPLTEPLPRK